MCDSEFASPLDRLARWYHCQCDGQWEHHQGVQIQSLDNPGWLVKINLTGTPLAGRRFPAIRTNTSTTGWPQSGRWLHCEVVENIWQGAGDETKLTEILELFLAWGEAG
jgi:hypothetical protein